ncbi:MAG: hypothetical protein H7Y12_10025, partial [Sphingobacteriaceae bacterium]|nr:hypothetical protein [Cytophagaceae bacterium]
MKTPLLFRLFLFLLLAGSVRPGCAQLLATARQSPKAEAPGAATRPLKDALLELKARFSVDLLFGDRVVEGYMVPNEAGVGEGLERALDQLLRPHGLKFRKVKEGTYLISTKKSAKEALPVGRFPEALRPETGNSGTRERIETDVLSPFMSVQSQPADVT